MRYIDNSNLEQTAIDIGWDAIRQNHLNNMANLSIADRKTYITGHPDWNLFQADMLALSHNKCWYSEAPIGNGDFEVDHFRPKNKAKQKIDYNNTKSKSLVHKETGYWWKAYDWDNYRLAGALANKLRRDRLGDCEDVKGKGDYFPLDLVLGRVANDEENLSCEEPILLDPTNPVDVSLLTFDKGIPIPATTENDEIDRVKQSIFYYHLDLDQLNTARKIVWDDCVSQIKDAKRNIDNSLPAVKKAMVRKCFEELIKLVDSERKSYTSTAKACLMVYSELDGYSWLKNLVRTL
ncbi:hypothetical protein [Mucilaginibacter sp. SJ]|uniref:hypothetical protein n=1 Tax=Mucilaginibacter sp. SJ TaxID=3029053 RepID=UPI0023A93898|nr:hypothetical protein [Mucilaginibacter sp. SJ]WDZ99444.1 hypothetical protein MusilaSJ_18430 [Mucilaginibacter sp. SJ]